LFVCLCDDTETAVVMLLTKRQFHWSTLDMAGTAAVFMGRQLI
jgi:hypothetical protein